MNLCVTVEGSPRVNALPSSSSSTWPEMSNKSNPVSFLPHLVHVLIVQYGLRVEKKESKKVQCRILLLLVIFLFSSIGTTSQGGS